MSSRSGRSDGLWHSGWGRWHQEDRPHMKINLSVFKDEDAKDAVTYQSWRWDLMVYWCVGCRDHTLLPYAIRSLQGYPGELVQSSGMDITLDDVLTILDEHYNNVKALDALNQVLFQLWMVDNETVLDWGVHLWRHLQVLAASFSDCFPPDWVADLKRSLSWQAPQATESDGSLPKGWSTGKNLFRLCEKLRRKTPWSWPGAPGLRQLILLPNQGLPVSPPWGNSRATSPFQKAHCAFYTFGRRGCQWWWRPREWWSWQNWKSDGRVYSTLDKGCKGCPSRLEMLLPF